MLNIHYYIAIINNLYETNARRRVKSWRYEEEEEEEVNFAVESRVVQVI